MTYRPGRTITIAAFALIAGCGSAEQEPVGAATAEESTELNNAATMIEDVSPDGLSAPGNMELPRESETTSETNAAAR